MKTQEERKPLTVGDRVKLKGFGNIGGESADVEGRIGEIKAVLHGGRLNILCESDEWNIQVYPSQCTRLIKKPAREWWVNVYTSGVNIHDSLSRALDDAGRGSSQFRETVYVREVKTKPVIG